MRRYPWRTKTPSTGRVVLRRGRDRSVGAGAALPERGDAEGADDEEGDRALVRPLRLRIDRGDGVLRLPFHDRLRPDPREVAHDGIRSEEHTSELQSHSDLHSFPTRRSSDLFYVEGVIGVSEPERRFQNVATPRALTTRRAIALLFGRFVSVSIVGTASFAFRFMIVFAPIHAR